MTPCFDFNNQLVTQVPFCDLNVQLFDTDACLPFEQADDAAAEDSEPLLPGVNEDYGAESVQGLLQVTPPPPRGSG